MGMDVYGLAPDDKSGEYYRCTIFYWHPLWVYVSDKCKDILTIGDRKGGHVNDGNQYDLLKSMRIAKRLFKLIESGEAANDVALHQAHLDSIPDVECDLCGGTGYRVPPPAADDPVHDLTVITAHTMDKYRGPGNYPCNVCKTTGHHRPYGSMSKLDLNAIKDFAIFCSHSGGFEIC
jgi:hypothetical protein